MQASFRDHKPSIGWAVAVYVAVFQHAGAQTNLASLTEAVPGPAAGLSQSVPFLGGTDGYHTYRIPSIALNGAGQLVALCEGRKAGTGDAGNIDTVCRISEDGGRTWGKLSVVWDDGANTCGNPCVVRDAEKDVMWLLHTWNCGDDREPAIINQTSKDTRRVFVSRSTDGGREWVNRREITADAKLTNWTWYATGPGAGIQLERGPNKGRMVIPCDHIEAGSKKYYSHVIYSDDHGATWKLGGTTPNDKVNECEVVELSDGALMLNMRSYDPSQKARQTAISRDGGLTWTEQKIVPELVDPICQASIRRLSWPGEDKPGVILFANAGSTRREKMTVRASFDEGKTWAVSRLVSRHPAAYSCLVPLPGGAIGLLYETGTKHPYQSIVFSSFSLEWLKQNQ